MEKLEILCCIKPCTHTLPATCALCSSSSALLSHSYREAMFCFNRVWWMQSTSVIACVRDMLYSFQLRFLCDRNFPNVAISVKYTFLRRVSERVCNFKLSSVKMTTLHASRLLLAHHKFCCDLIEISQTSLFVRNNRRIEPCSTLLSKTKSRRHLQSSCVCCIHFNCSFFVIEISQTSPTRAPGFVGVSAVVQLIQQHHGEQRVVVVRGLRVRQRRSSRYAFRRMVYTSR